MAKVSICKNMVLVYIDEKRAHVHDITHTKLTHTLYDAVRHGKLFNQ